MPISHIKYADIAYLNGQDHLHPTTKIPSQPIKESAPRSRPNTTGGREEARQRPNLRLKSRIRPIPARRHPTKPIRPTLQKKTNLFHP